MNQQLLQRLGRDLRYFIDYPDETTVNGIAREVVMQAAILTVKNSILGKDLGEDKFDSEDALKRLEILVNRLSTDFSDTIPPQMAQLLEDFQEYENQTKNEGKVEDWLIKRVQQRMEILKKAKFVYLTSTQPQKPIELTVPEQQVLQGLVDAAKDAPAGKVSSVMVEKLTEEIKKKITADSPEQANLTAQMAAVDIAQRAKEFSGVPPVNTLAALTAISLAPQTLKTVVKESAVDQEKVLKVVQTQVVLDRGVPQVIAYSVLPKNVVDVLFGKQDVPLTVSSVPTSGFAGAINLTDIIEQHDKYEKSLITISEEANRQSSAFIQAEIRQYVAPGGQGAKMDEVLQAASDIKKREGEIRVARQYSFEEFEERWRGDAGVFVMPQVRSMAPAPAAATLLNLKSGGFGILQAATPLLQLAAQKVTGIVVSKVASSAIFAKIGAAVGSFFGPLGTAVMAWAMPKIIKAIGTYKGAILGFLGAAIGGLVGGLPGALIGGGIGALAAGVKPKELAEKAFKIFSVLTVAVFGAIAVPMVVSMVTIVLLTAFILFIINSGAYVVPPSKLTNLTSCRPADSIATSPANLPVCTTGCFKFEDGWPGAAKQEEIQALTHLAQASIYMDKLCKRGDILLRWGGNAKRIGGDVLGGENLITIYTNGVGGLPNALYTIAHESGHIFARRYGAVLRQYFDTPKVGNILICTYPENPENGTHNSPGESFAEMIALYAAKDQIPTTRHFNCTTNKGVLFINLKTSYLDHWQFAHNSVFEEDLNW